ncbi:hypothetical protein HQ865_01450 [Mucilaginibacter mali]|uniref:Uncharacterized protein n=1 Tax=Mucilaginibacter mali TaxID=2740462 RepID=A0A7D4U8U3_9SPHI|nr:hypothetical protein [Mucilaginibacter mali]QKJ28478.1 hypothetical protein HQ865_01450 [Mucilaginibacter mali]
MNIIPQIITQPLSSNDNGINTTYRAAIYISIVDAATGEQVPGNGIGVTYQYFYNGTPGITRTQNVIGSLLKIDDADYLEVSNYDGQPVYQLEIRIIAYDNTVPDEPPVDTTNCDVVITAVNIDSKESAPGADDAQITILAQSSQLPLNYSLDGVTYQPSPVFNGLHGGTYMAYVSDARGCTTTYNFSIETIKNLLIAGPSVNIGGSNISRWNAAFNPVVFTYQRKDFEVTNITADGNGKAIINISGSLAGLNPKDMVYLSAGAYKGVYEVKSVSAGQISIDIPYTSTDHNGGYININSLRPYYQVITEISYLDKGTSNTQIIRSVNRPDQTGLVKADISSFLQSLLYVQDGSNYSEINFRDINLSASYTIRYAEVWDNNNPIYISIENPYYVVYAAKQLGDAYGGNLANYVPFPSVDSQTKRASWITDFSEPVYSNGYPFDIGFIYSEALAGLDIYCELTMLDINRQPITGSTQAIGLLNEDGSFLINQDGSRYIIADSSTNDFPIAQHVGLNRLLIDQTFPPEAYYFTLTLKYDVDEVTHTITQTQTVRVDDMVDDRSVYLRWIGLTGSWNYYRFVYNQEVSLDVQNATIIKNYVSDWANQSGIEEVISKTAGQKMKVLAEDLSVADIKGLQSIKYSPKVQMLVNRNPVKWQTVVINTATFAEYETRNGQAPFSVTFNLPGINIQTQ